VSSPARFSTGKAFAGQQRLIHEQIARLEQAPVRRDEASAGERYHVAGDHLRYRDVLDDAVAQHGGADLHRLAQPLRGASGAVFLNEIEW
jgi:hypothetical protein